MQPLSSEERRSLRALAHKLDPVVMIAQRGLTASVMKEIDLCLNAHELIKVRVHGDDRLLREAYLAEICQTLHAYPVQHIGKLLLIWRAREKAETQPEKKPLPKKPAVKKKRILTSHTSHVSVKNPVRRGKCAGF